MLWTNEQRRRIRLGEITATIRAWRSAHVSAGKRYRFDDEYELAIRAVDTISTDAVSEDDARAAGFASREALLAELKRVGPNPLEAGLFRVRFALEPAQSRPAPTEGEVATLVERLRKLDRLSDHGPWTRDALAVIAENPRVVSTELARRVGRERFAFKADVRKLKRLGLTRSHDIGYEVTEVGRVVLAALGAPDSPSPAQSGERAGG